MPEPFDLSDLKIPQDSEFCQMLARCPDIASIRFRDEEYLIREGEECRDVFLVLKGTYAVEQLGTATGRRPGEPLAVISSTPTSASFVGEMAYFGSGFRTASVRSSMATYTLCLKPEHLDIIINEFPMLTRILCQQFTARLRETTATLREYQERVRMDGEQVFAQPGQVIFEQGQQADKLYQLVDGTLLRMSGGPPTEVTLETTLMGFIEPGPYFAGGTYGATVKAKTTAILAAVPRASLSAVVRNYPQLLIALYVQAAKA